MTHSGKHTLWVIAVTALFAGLFTFIYLHDPNGPFLGVPCWLNSWSGYYCPGCGGTRAVHYLMHGEFMAALSANALFPILLPLTVYFLVSISYEWTFRKHMPGIPVPRWIWVVFAILFVLFWILRNIPVAPFNWFAP